MKIKDIISLLEEWTPLQYQEDYDNSGLQVGNPENMLTGIVVCLDVNEKIIDFALENNSNLIISHHPLIFKPIKCIASYSEQDKMIVSAIKNDLCIYSLHTNLDNSTKGINFRIGEMLELTGFEILKPISSLLYKIVVFCPDVKLADGIAVPEKVRQAMFDAGAGNIGEYDSCSFNSGGLGTYRGSAITNPFIGEQGILESQKEIKIETIVPEHLLKKVITAMLSTHPYEDVAYDIFELKNENKTAGAGLVGSLISPMNVKAFLNYLKEKLNLSQLRHSSMLNRNIERVAICSGSGSFLINEAIKKRADVFITADLKYHDFFTAENKILLIDIGHYESEIFSIELISDFLKEKISTFAIHKIKQNFNPVNYF